jgi:ADP-ribose pyrophosphatase
MSSYEYPDRPQLAVGAIVMRNNKVLLVKRGRPPGEGLWAVPGGRVRLGETLKEAVEREVREETRLIVRAGNPVYAFDLIERDEEDRIQYHYVVVDLLADYIKGQPSPDDDALEARWVSLEALRDLPASRTTREVLRKTADFGPT